MKAYNFAKITARPYPNMCDVNNKWIFTPETGAVINVSQKYKADIVEAIKQKGIEYHHFPQSLFPISPDKTSSFYQPYDTMSNKCSLFLHHSIY